MWVLNSRTGLAGLALVGVIGGCADRPGSAPAQQRPDVTVRAMAAQPLEDTRVLHFAGVVESRERATLTFQVDGVMRERFVALGQRVIIDQPLARLFNPELDPARDAALERVREVEAEAEQVRRDLIRARQLFERGVLTEQERDRQEARLDALEASIGSARAGLRGSEQLHREAHLAAPFAGVVEALFMEPGEYVAAGQPVVRLAAPDGLKVEVTVPARMLSGLRVGDRIPVRSPLEGWNGQGRVTEIGASGSEESRALPPGVEPGRRRRESRRRRGRGTDRPSPAPLGLAVSGGDALHRGAGGVPGRCWTGAASTRDRNPVAGRMGPAGERRTAGR
jgi:membrane fusion protein, multidrug efflux system